MQFTTNLKVRKQLLKLYHMDPVICHYPSSPCTATCTKRGFLQQVLKTTIPNTTLTKD